MRTIDHFTALNRFGLGARPGEADRIGDDPRGWVEAQLDPNPTLPRAFAAFEHSREILKGLHAARQQANSALRKETMRAYRSSFGPEIMARARVAIGTDTPLLERLVMFWSNHFTVSNTKRILGPAIPAYEREAIRPHILGRFEDMLIAVIKHPVMLAYLDNVLSIGENSRLGKRRIKRTGKTKTINENLAREVLELHTLGVRSGYTQDDVNALAGALTGWAFGGVRAGSDGPIHGGFAFRPAMHEPGAKVLLNKTYAEDGEGQGTEMLRDLARHPATARFIATKIARHFTSDTPLESAVTVLEEVYLQTGGDLAEVMRTLILRDEAWAHPGAKVKTHYEFLIAAHRATGNTRVAPHDVMEPLREFGQMPFTAPSPAGWGDRAADWISPEGLMRRIEWVRQFAAKRPPVDAPSAVLDDVIGPLADDQTRLWTDRAPSGDAALAMILASPEFQRR